MLFNLWLRHFSIIILQAGISAIQLAKKYELDFFKDMEAMRVLPPTVVSHVSESIHLIVSFCENLIEKKVAYVTEEGFYFFFLIL